MFIPSLLSANAGPIHTTCMHGQLACSSGACHLLRDSGTDMAHILQRVWSTVSAFVIDTRSLRSISDSVNAIRAMSAVSKTLGVMVQDTCEAAYTQHEVWKMVVPFAVEAWLTCCTNELATHHHIWCPRCVEENDGTDDTMGPFYFRGCSECDSVTAIQAVVCGGQLCFGNRRRLQQEYEKSLSDFALNEI